MKIYRFISWTKSETNPRYKLNVKARSLDVAQHIAESLMDSPVYQGEKPV